MRNLRKKIIHIFICYCFLFLLSSCSDVNIPIPSVPNLDDNSNQQQEDDISVYYSLGLKGNPELITDCTPELIIFTEVENIISMSFSGNGYDWSGWMEYAESYDRFNIACGLYGTTMQSGDKKLYVRFKDIEGNIFPQDYQEPISCSFYYQMQELFCIRIEPEKVQLKTGESHNFTVKGYDLFVKNEVPLSGEKIYWTKSCGVGKLNPSVGLQTTYTAPDVAGMRDISAHYGALGTGAWVEVVY